MEPVRGVYVQRAGLSLAEARELLAATTLHGNIPEPLRLAHLIAGGIVTGKSGGGPSAGGGVGAGPLARTGRATMPARRRSGQGIRR